MYTYPWYHWIIFFFFYSFCGWVFESTYVSLRKKRFVNRGFLRLPMLPLYGSGAVMMLWVSLPFQDSLPLVYLSGLVGATLLEYVTGYVMERLFKVRYWDYSSHRFQLHGYICLSSSIAWGFLTILMTEVLHKPVARVVMEMNPTLEFCLIAVLGAVFAADTVQSIREALDLARALEAVTRIRAELEELQVQLALLKSETIQKTSELKAETLQRTSELKAETLQKTSELKEEMRQRASELKSETRQRINDRLQELTDAHERLTHHLSFYRRDMLRGNPGATSKRFSEALAELREIAESYKRH